MKGSLDDFVLAAWRTLLLIRPSLPTRTYLKLRYVRTSKETEISFPFACLPDLISVSSPLLSCPPMILFLHPSQSARLRHACNQCFEKELFCCRQTNWALRFLLPFLPERFPHQDGPFTTNASKESPTAFRIWPAPTIVIGACSPSP